MLHSIQFGRHVIIIGIATTLMSIQGIILLPLLAKNLGVYGYGIWSLINTTISLISLVAVMGLGSTMIRFLAAEKSDESLREKFFSIFYVVLLSASILSALLFLYSEQFAITIFKDSSSNIYIKVASFGIIFESLLQISLTYFTAVQKINKLAILKLSSVILNILLVLAVLYVGYHLLAVLIATVVAKAIIFMVAIIDIIKTIKFESPRRDNQIFTYLSFGLPLILVSGFSWIVQSSDRYVIAYFLDPSSVGSYSAAYALGSLTAIFAHPIGLILYPTVSKAYDDGNLSAVEFYIRNSFKYYLILAIPSAFGLSLLSGHLLLLLGNEDFVNASIIVPFIAFGLILWRGFSIIAERVLTLVKRTVLIAGSLGVASFLNIILNMLLIPKFYLLGAAVATFVSCLWLAIVTALVLTKYLSIRLDLIHAIKCIVSSTIMLYFVAQISISGWPTLLLSVFVGFCIYFITLFCINGLSKDEIVYLRDAIFSKKGEGLL